MAGLLDQINAPSDLKSLSGAELLRLTREIREQMLVRLSAAGGHVGSNLGMVEATVALHAVFDSPVDKIVFDVSHQCYTHKLLTGRKAAYLDPARYADVTGFTNPSESEHDIFAVGHTSTAVSLACGLAKARDLKGEHYNVIAVVGDGALSGGEAFEGLNNAAALESNLIILVNDNDMSIAENHGGIYQNLKALRETGGKAPCNFFRALGLDYRFVSDGNDLNEVMAALSGVKDADHPVVVHMCTVKGKGYCFAEADRENWHQRGPFDRATGEPLQPPDNAETYENLTRDFLAERMKRDPTVTAITAGTPKILGFDEKLRKQYPKQFIDVGIAEEHAIAFASGIAKNGGKPVFGVSSTFLQRTYDQLSHDLALNHSPAVILVFFAGISQGSQTHMGVFDISLVRNIPNLVCLAPTCKEEYLRMLDWGLCQNSHPVIIRVPGIATATRRAELLPAYGPPARYEVAEWGNRVAILALGRFFTLGLQVKEALENAARIRATLINPRCVSDIDTGVLETIKSRHQVVATLEDGILDGGFGEQIAGFYGASGIKVLNYGARKEFADLVAAEKLYDRYRLTAEQITSDILDVLQINEEGRERPPDCKELD